MFSIHFADPTTAEEQNTRVAVIGVGPAGMTAALQLSRAGVEVEVFEASQHIGGMSRSFELWGQRVDLGLHRFFNTNEQVNQTWLDIVGDQYGMVSRKTRIYYQNHFYDYPLRPLNAFRNLGLPVSLACLASYFKEKLPFGSSSNDSDSFESWVVQRFGRRLFETFFKSYSEKLWGIPYNELSDDFATQRIKQFSLLKAMMTVLSMSRSQRHETLLDRFAYPLGGTGAIYEKMAA